MFGRITTRIKLFTKNNRKKLFYISVIVFLLNLTVITTCNLIVETTSSNLVYSELSSIPYNRVGLLLGTSKYIKTGHLNPYFENRIDAAVKLYKSGKVKIILVSGDNGHVSYNEPRQMTQELIKRGIPADSIVLDYAGFRTLDSVVRCNKVFGQERFTIISQEFHNKRAIFIAQNYGLYAIGYNAKDISLRSGLKTKTRELLARVKVLIDLHLINKGPKFLGDKIVIK